MTMSQLFTNNFWNKSKKPRLPSTRDFPSARPDLQENLCEVARKMIALPHRPLDDAKDTSGKVTYTPQGATRPEVEREETKATGTTSGRLPAALSQPPIVTVQPKDDDETWKAPPPRTDVEKRQWKVAQTQLSIASPNSSQVPSKLSEPRLHFQYRTNLHFIDTYRAVKPIKRARDFKERFSKEKQSIGKGSESHCHKWNIKTGQVDKLTGKGITVVIKSIDKKEYRRFPPWAPEIHILEILQKHRHSNIVEYFNWYDAGTATKDWIVLGHCDAGETWALKTSYDAQRKKFPEIFVWNIITQLNSALAFLHEGYGTEQYGKDWTPIIHRDIKENNILLQNIPGSSLPRVRLTDFGGAMRIGDPSNTDSDSNVIGNVWFHPPEGEQTQAAGDMWACGSVLAALCLGETPIDCKEKDDEVNGANPAWIAACRHRVIPINIEPSQRRRQQRANCAQMPWAGVYSDVLNHYMHRFLDFDPKTRMTAVEAVEQMNADFDRFLAETSVEDFDNYEMAVKQVGPEGRWVYCPAKAAVTECQLEQKLAAVEI